MEDYAKHDAVKRGYSSPLFYLTVVLCTLLGSIFLWNTWRHYRQIEKENAVGLAQSAEAFISADLVKALEGNQNDLKKPEYQQLKDSMIRFKLRNQGVHFVYLYTVVGEDIYFMVDSETPGSEGYSPPGQLYDEAAPEYKTAFLEGKTVFAGPTTDRWGTWVNALTPVRDPETGEVLAIFGVDYPEKLWKTEIIKHVWQSAGLMLCLLLLLIGMYRIQKKNNVLKALGNRLKVSEELFRTVFEQAPVGIGVIGEYRFLAKMNKMFEQILGRDKKQLETLNWIEITHPDDLEEDLSQFERFQSGEIRSYSMEKRFLKEDGSYSWVNMAVAALDQDQTKGASLRHLCIIEDINQRKTAEEALLESERSKAVLLRNLPGMAYRCRYDKEWTMLFVSDGCFELTGYEPESLVYNKDLSYNDLVAPEYRSIVWDQWAQLIDENKSFRFEYQIICANGQRKWVLELAQGIPGASGRTEILEGIIIDISDQKEREEQIKYMIDHDYMTGLYNRKYYEESMEKLDRPEYLPLSMIVADINGLRLINDAFGYSEGDKLIGESTRILQSCCRQGDVLARLGGDEFGILLPETDSETAYSLLNTIKGACTAFNERNKAKWFEINLSIGYATKEAAEDSIEEIERKADEYLRNRKLFSRESIYSDIISSMMATVYEKSEETEEHAERLAALAKKIGEKLSLSQKSIGELELLAVLHDIGKVGIDDRILNKPCGLDEEERDAMKNHPEIGYRIAKTSAELEPIAEYILTHHERWDGKGYPQGLKGEEIPLLSRILAVADAYDAMTQDRVYRKALTREQAINEIKKHAGTQFDPKIAEIFTESI